MNAERNSGLSPLVSFACARAFSISQVLLRRAVLFVSRGFVGVVHENLQVGQFQIKDHVSRRLSTVFILRERRKGKAVKAKALLRLVLAYAAYC